MKNLLAIALAIMALASCQPQRANHGSPSDFKIFKGTNIAHWLSQSIRRGAERDSFFQEKDVVLIKSLGFDHIRLTIDEEQMWDENGARHDEAFKLLTNCLDWCQKHDLKVIVNLHILRSPQLNTALKPTLTDPKEQERFFKLWSDLSATLKKYSLSDVAYELMNECTANDPEKWNNLVNNAVTKIRKLEPERILVIGSNIWQSAKTFDVLKVPNDKNIILSFHFYEPFLLTLFHAGWTGFKNYSGPVHYPGILISKAEFDALPADQQKVVKDCVDQEWNMDKLDEMMQLPVKKGKELGLQVYCGEYGTIDGSPEADKIRWYKDIIAVFKKNGIASANWNYKSGAFGLVNSSMRMNKPVIEAVCKR